MSYSIILLYEGNCNYTNFAKNKNKCSYKIPSWRNKTMAVTTAKFRFFRRKQISKINSFHKDVDLLEENASTEDIERFLAIKNNPRRLSTYYIEALNRIR